MNDWDKVYMRAVLDILSGLSPYSRGTFGSPPWSLLLFTPLAWIPPQVAMLFPALALLVLSIRRRQPLLLLVVGTSFPFIASSIYSNVDWLVMLGVAIGGRWGVVLDTIKPQDGLFAIAAELAKREGWRARVKLLVPMAILAVITVPLLYPWLHEMFIVGHSNDGIRNFSLFPYSIPLGLLLLALAWKRKEPLWGVAASLCLSPYFYISSALPFMFLLASKNIKWGIVASLIGWTIVGLILTGVIPIRL